MRPPARPAAGRTGPLTEEFGAPPAGMGLAGWVPRIDPPERIDAGPIVLRRAAVTDAAPLARAVGESLEHLRPWMPWATPEAATVAAQTARLAGGGWGPTDHTYLMVAGDGGIVGACGLHRRTGADRLEIGYWVHAGHTGRGYATAAAAALTTTALALPGIERVEIHCDEANAASAAVPRRLGYELERTEERAIESPAQTGRFMVWVTRQPPKNRSASSAGNAGDHR